MKLVENEVSIQVDLDKVTEWDIQKGQGLCNKNTVVIRCFWDTTMSLKEGL